MSALPPKPVFTPSTIANQSESVYRRVSRIIERLTVDAIALCEARREEFRALFNFMGQFLAQFNRDPISASPQSAERSGYLTGGLKPGRSIRIDPQ